jgi:glycine/D-amino acid oxidase-like deaminating enzyme
MMTQSDSPISIHPAYLPRVLPWLLRNVLQSRRSVVNCNAEHLHALSQHEVASWQQLISKSNLASLFRTTGWLKVYESEKSFASSLTSQQLLDQRGTPYDLLNAAEIGDLEPNLDPIFKHGLYQQDCMSVSKLERLVKGFGRHMLDSGGASRPFAVDQIVVTDDGINLKGLGGNLSADKIVIAAGVWSRSLASQLDDNIPLNTELGYHLMMPRGNQNLLSRPVLNEDSSFVLCRIKTGLRMTAQVKLAGLDIAPNFNKIRSLVPAAKRMLPKLDTQKQSEWMGFRPSLPDSLPALGFSSKTDNVLYAFGHQHLGMTLAAITSQVIAVLVANRKHRSTWPRIARLDLSHSERL